MKAHHVLKVVYLLVLTVCIKYIWTEMGDAPHDLPECALHRLYQSSFRNARSPLETRPM